ncbi:MAG: hypothetical protein K2N31_07650 [Treponemataceae bacterium]|nr:hypothetical protein [Treponemataceae bacterium]
MFKKSICITLVLTALCVVFAQSSKTTIEGAWFSDYKKTGFYFTGGRAYEIGAAYDYISSVTKGYTVHGDILLIEGQYPYHMVLNGNELWLYAENERVLKLTKRNTLPRAL